MTSKDDDMLARFIALENMVAALIARSPERDATIADFDAFQAQQAAMQVAQGMPLAFADAFREAHANLLGLVSAKGQG